MAMLLGVASMTLYGRRSSLRCATATAHIVERACTAIGMVASLSALICLLALGVGWMPVADFLGLWMVLAGATSPLSLVADRCMRRLFWL